MALGPDGGEIVDVGAVAEVVPRGKVVALGRQHDDPRRIILSGDIKGLIQLREHQIVLGVGAVAAGQGDSCDTLLGLVQADAFPAG